MPFSLELMWNRHSVRWRSRRSRSGYRFELPELLIRPLDRPQIFTGGSGCRFLWSRCGIATQIGGGRVARDQRPGLKGP